MRGPFFVAWKNIYVLLLFRVEPFSRESGVTEFYRDEEIEVTDVAVKTMSETYPLEQIASLRAEYRLWSKERTSAFVALCCICLAVC